MKIVYVITQLGVGGAENVLVSMANRMLSLGHRIYIISLLNICEQEFSEGIEVFTLDFKKNTLSSFFNLCNLINRINPDVVHSHCLHANIVTRFVRLIIPIKKLVTTAHNTNEGKGLIMKAFKYTNFLSDVITNVSTDAVNVYERKNYVSKNIMRVMFNVIDIDSYLYSHQARVNYRKNFNINENEIVLISIGMFKEAKDYPNLIRAISYIKENYTKRFKFFIVGDGEQYSQVIEMVNAINLSDCVSFLGKRNDIRALLSMSDFFVLASRHEGLPTVLIEAIMANNYVISTDCGGINDILPNTESVVPIQDHISLAEMIILKMNESQHYRNRWVERTQNYVYKKFNPELIISRWLEIYQK